MLKNYIKIAIRKLLKHKTFSAINILGLAMSMAVCLLILLFIVNQKSYDHFHEHSDRIYRVYSDYKAAVNSSSNLYATAPINMAKLLREEYTWAEDAVQVRQFGGQVEKKGIELTVSGLYADSSFFNVFSFPLVAGNASTALAEPYSLVLTQEAALRIFGSDEVMGQALIIDGEAYTVTGLLDTHPQSTNLTFEILVSFKTLEIAPQHQGLFHSWHSANRSSYAFIMLKEGVTSKAIESELPNLIKEHYPPNDEAWLENLYLQRLTDINLGIILENDLGIVLPNFFGYFLGFLALIIMLAACFNYVNLSVARSLTRAREVGMRKVSGAARSQIIRQFLSEAVVIALLSLVLSIVLLFWLIPSFNQLWVINFAGSQITINPFAEFEVYLIFIGFSVFVGLLAGFYPALYLSRFSPVKVLKGVLHNRFKSKMTFRSTLVVIQFTLSLFFIITALLVYFQFQYMTDSDLGFETENIVNVQLQDVEYEILRQQLEMHPDVISISAASLMPMSGSRHDTWMEVEGMEKPEKGYRMSIDHNFIENLGLSLIAGRNFSSSYSTESASSVILNRKSLQRLNLGTPLEAIGNTITLSSNWDVQVVGVVEDFHTMPLVMEIDPMLLTYEPEGFRVANIRVREGRGPIVMNHIEQAWSELGSAFPLYAEHFTGQIEQEPAMMMFKDLLSIISLITGFAVFVACMGLFGMATFTAETRIREVGVRKVLGASVSNIIYLLTGNFARLVGIGVLLGIPMAWFANNLWIQQFAYRVEIGPAVFVFGVGLLFVLSIIAVGTQVARVAQTNPVNSLRYE